MKFFILALFFCLQVIASERIVALSPSINEIIYALGDGDKIVGNTTYCTYPNEAKTKTKVGGYFSPSLEKILSLKPDMVIMQQSSFNLSQKLKKLGVKTQVLNLKSLNDIKNSITIIGDILDKKIQAQKILHTINIKLKEIQGIIKNKKILIVIGQNLSLEKHIFVAGQNLYFDDIITTSGNTNAFQSNRVGQPILNMENIIATNPDIVVLLAPFIKDKNITNEQLINPWLNLPINAKKTNSIYIVGKHYAGIASDRITYFLEDFKGFLTDVRNKKLQ